MLALLINGHKNEFIVVRGKKVRRDFGPGLETGIMFKKDDILYKTIDFNDYIDTLDWELIEEDDDNYIIHNGSCWIFKEKKSLFGSVIAEVFENKNMVNNLF